MATLIEGFLWALGAMFGLTAFFTFFMALGTVLEGLRQVWVRGSRKRRGRRLL